jgi:hypothetical protein
MLNFKDYVRKKNSHNLNLSGVCAIWVSQILKNKKKVGKESTNCEDSLYVKELTEVARLTSDNVKNSVQCSGHTFMSFLYVKDITICASFVMKFCIPIERNLKSTEMSVSYIIPLFGGFYQGCPRPLWTALVYDLLY